MFSVGLNDHHADVCCPFQDWVSVVHSANRLSRTVPRDQYPIKVYIGRAGLGQNEQRTACFQYDMMADWKRMMNGFALRFLLPDNYKIHVSRRCSDVR